jgi:hypothetical protein
MTIQYDFFLRSLQGFNRDGDATIRYGGYHKLSQCQGDGLPFPLRTYASTVKQANLAEAFLQSNPSPADLKGHGSRFGGVNGRSPFLDLSYFDVTTDCCLDMMHLTTGVIERMLIPLLNGQRFSKESKQARLEAHLTAAQRKANEAAEEGRRQNSAQAKRDLATAKRKRAAELRDVKAARLSNAGKRRAYHKLLQENAKMERRDDSLQIASDRLSRKAALQQRMREGRRDPLPNVAIDFAHVWTVPIGTLKRVELDCYARFIAPSNIAPPDKRPFTFPGQMAAYQWINFVKGYGQYLIKQCGLPLEQERFACDLLAILQMCLASRFKPETHLALLKAKIRKWAGQLNTNFPDKQKTVMLHSVMFHMVDTMRLWGPCRGYWNFPFERCVRQFRYDS